MKAKKRMRKVMKPYLTKEEVSKDAIVVSILSDLQHYCERKQFDFEQLLNLGKEKYTTDVQAAVEKAQAKAEAKNK